MEFVRSTDGTAIAYRRSGAGPALLFVHGITADHMSWARVSPYSELILDKTNPISYNTNMLNINSG
jgi:pimeloyl-ACP methyl ester carboxylesterase